MFLLYPLAKITNAHFFAAKIFIMLNIAVIMDISKRTPNTRTSQSENGTTQRYITNPVMLILVPYGIPEYRSVTVFAL